jgi:hypothetical protein
MQVNNGQYRKTTFTIRRFLFNREILSGVFPVIETINNAFGEIPAITLEDFAFLPENEYLNRLNLFYDYLETRYSFFKKTDWPSLESIELPTGENFNQCPLNYAIEKSLFANLNLNCSESEGNKEAFLDLELLRFNGVVANALNSFEVTLLVKEYFGMGLIDWSTIQGQLVKVNFGIGDQFVRVMELFRYLGVNDQTKEFKNIHVQILEIEEETGIEIGMINTAYTNGFVPFFMVNLISNIYDSFQDFPNIEALESIVVNGQGIVNGSQSSFIYEFEPNQKSRPVFLYPATYPDLSSINFSEDSGVDILDSNAFDLNNGEPKITILDSVEYKVYASKNMIVYPKRIKYNYTF